MLRVSLCCFNNKSKILANVALGLMVGPKLVQRIGWIIIRMRTIIYYL